MRLSAIPSLRELIRVYGLRAQKQLSQNFLLQPSSINSLVKCAGSLTDACVLEVGPGPGGLTRAIIRQKPRHLIVVEIDRRFLPCLEELRLSASEYGVKMDIYRADILQLNTANIFPIQSICCPEQWGSGITFPHEFFSNQQCTGDQSTALIEQGDDKTIQPPRVRILGNLPFNISTPLLINWLENVASRRQIWQFGRIPMTLTFQKEVCERLSADVWGKQRSRLSVMAQAFCEVKYLKEIPASAFVPIPKVDAGVVRLTPLSEPIISVPFPYVEKLVRQAFHFRQKQIVRCLETLFPPNRPELIEKLFRQASVQPMKRPYQLSNLEFRDLCEAYTQICRSNEEVFSYDYRSNANLPNWRNRKTIQREILGHTVTGESIRNAIMH